MEWLDVLILAAATQRLLGIWMNERITEPIRLRLQARGGWVAYLAGCGQCLSVWFAGGTVAAWGLGGPLVRAVVIALAISGVALAWNSLMVLWQTQAMRSPK